MSSRILNQTENYTQFPDEKRERKRDLYLLLDKIMLRISGIFEMLTAKVTDKTLPCLGFASKRRVQVGGLDEASWL